MDFKSGGDLPQTKDLMNALISQIFRRNNENIKIIHDFIYWDFNNYSTCM